MENREGGSTGFMKNRNVFNWIKTNIKEIGVKSIINNLFRTIILLLCFFSLLYMQNCKAEEKRSNDYIEQYFDIYRLNNPRDNKSMLLNRLVLLPSEKRISMNYIKEKTGIDAKNLNNTIVLYENTELYAYIEIDAYMLHEIDNHCLFSLLINQKTSSVVAFLTIYERCSIKNLYAAVCSQSSMEKICAIDSNVYYNPLTSSEVSTYHFANDGCYYKVKYKPHAESLFANSIQKIGFYDCPEFVRFVSEISNAN